MEEIIRWVERLAEDELERANDEFPLHRSKWEAYGVLREEFIKARKEWETFCNSMDKVEITTLSDMNEESQVARVAARQTALYLIAELIQNVAMLDKWTQSEQMWELWKEV